MSIEPEDIVISGLVATEVGATAETFIERIVGGSAQNVPSNTAGKIVLAGWGAGAQSVAIECRHELAQQLIHKIGKRFTVILREET